MPVHVEWLNESEGIICIRIEGRWEWQALAAMFRSVMSEGNTRGRRFDVVFDAQSTQMPVGLVDAVRDIQQQIPKSQHHGINVIVGGRMVEAMLRLVMSIVPTVAVDNLFAPTLEEALTAIREHRRQNPPSAAPLSDTTAPFPNVPAP